MLALSRAAMQTLCQTTHTSPFTPKTQPIFVTKVNVKWHGFVTSVVSSTALQVEVSRKLSPFRCLHTPGKLVARFYNVLPMPRSSLPPHCYIDSTHLDAQPLWSNNMTLPFWRALGRVLKFNAVSVGYSIFRHSMLLCSTIDGFHPFK